MPDHIFFEDDEEEEEEDDGEDDDDEEDDDDDDDDDDAKDLDMAWFTFNHHTLIFSKAVHIHPVLHPILNITFLCRYKGEK